MKLFPLSAALVLALAACNQPTYTATTAEPAAATTLAPAPAATVSQALADAPAHYELTMDNVDRMFAAQRHLADAQNADPSLDAAMNASEEDGTQYAARLEATPQFRAAIAKAGMSTHDYAMTSEALIASLMAVGAVEAGALKEIPDGMDPQHIAFVKAHRPQIEAKMQALSQG